jgi:hypothetical protein
MSNYSDYIVDNWNDLVAEIIDFIEYEEAFTVDPKTQDRIRTKLIDLGIWKDAE